MVRSLEKILVSFPPETETKVISGHGDPASMDDLRNYVSMLKETIVFVETGIKNNRPSADMQSDAIMIKYKGLSEVERKQHLNMWRCCIIVEVFEMQQHTSRVYYLTDISLLISNKCPSGSLK